MGSIYRDILSGTMDAYASVISNNLNIVMKLLTSITVVLSIPTIIAGLWGMNVKGLPFSDSPIGFWAVLCLTLVISLVSYLLMKKKDMM
jgi:magnesium transporter